MSSKALDGVAETKKKMKKIDPSKFIGKIRKTICCNAKDIEFTSQYDCIYSCWCLGYMTNDDCYTLLVKIKKALKKDRFGYYPGLLVLKETVQDIDLKAEIHTEQ